MSSIAHVNLSIPGQEPASHLPWARWAMKGSHFKLLSADLSTDRFTLLIRVEPNVEAPLHRHVGTVEAFILEGGFYYREAPEALYTKGSYLFEPAGSVHQPVSTEGALMLGFFHGPIEGLDANGDITGRVDCTWHVQVWEATLAATVR
jgi:2,4'-dihydroxyacetophenone dioxygenase